MGFHVRSPDCRVKTPNYEVYGAMTVDIRVNISGEGWTVNKIQFNYFANTSAKNCLAYGPGLLPQVRSAGVICWFLNSLASASQSHWRESACKASSTHTTLSVSVSERKRNTGFSAVFWCTTNVAQVTVGMPVQVLLLGYMYAGSSVWCGDAIHYTGQGHLQ